LSLKGVVEPQVSQIGADDSSALKLYWLHAADEADTVFSASVLGALFCGNLGQLRSVL
jgi:hypothetical protein